ncbi:hypothetical protein [Pedobacter sp. R-06]|uniref:hypothetical protein n=1 Tax=Pedobacter sp. R-06 TaxID=3404051 RepID=UPI003CFA0007
MYQDYTKFAAVEAAPYARPLHGKLELRARSTRDKEQPEKPCTDGLNGNGFLNHRFLPLVEGYPEEIKTHAEVEREFFLSASHLCSLYRIRLDGCPDWPYPKNIGMAIEEIGEKIAVDDKDIKVIVVVGDDHSACLATVKTFDTKSTLYYLPVEPLYRLLKNDKEKSTAELLLSVVAYFYQIGGIPYHGENSSYLYYIYGGISERSIDEDCFADRQEQQYVIDHITFMENAGMWLLKEIKNPKNLKLFGKRLKTFKPSTEAEKNLLAISQRVAKLIKANPNRSIMESIHDSLDGADGDRVYAEQYLSFIWSFDDCLYDEVMEVVNCELQEYNQIDEPLTMQFFASPQEAVSHDHSFETEFFDLLNDLSDNLTDFAHEKYN